MKRFSKFLVSDIGRIISSLLFYIPALILEQIFDSSIWTLILYILALAICGGNVFVDAIRGILRGDLLDEKFLMSIASIGAMIIGDSSEGVAVMLFFLIGETFEHRAVRRSRSSIRSLMDICPDEACVITDEGEEQIDVEDVEIGSIIVIRPGERVPIDSVVISGSADVDTSSMTGEPLPISVSEGSQLLSGYIVKNGSLKAKTLRPAEESAAARVLALVENASENKSREESFITRFSRVYTPVVVVAAVLVAFLVPIFTDRSLHESIYTALTFLVISCPCALVISVPMAFFGGIGGAASRGILFKGGNVFSKVASVERAVFDKTGTLTNGKFVVDSIECYDIDKEKLLSYTASTEYASNHPIADSLKNVSANIIPYKSAYEYAGEGVIAEFHDVECAVGNARLMSRLGLDLQNFKKSNSTVYVAINNQLKGVITISDKIKEEASDAIADLRRLGVKRTYIFSGDREEGVKRVASALSIDEVYHSLTPEEKFHRLEDTIRGAKSTMYVGDGINDTPSLTRADVGVAMGNLGQDSAIESADVIIMTDNLSKLSEAVLIARKTIRISWQNIIFALGTKGLVLILGLIGFADIRLAVFADVGVAVIAILNSMRALRAPK